MPLTEVQIYEISRDVTEAGKTGTPVTYVTETFPQITVQEAYAVQFRSLQTRLGNSEVIVGRKIGLSSRANQEMFGIDRPARFRQVRESRTPPGMERVDV